MFLTTVPVDWRLGVFAKRGSGLSVFEKSRPRLGVLVFSLATIRYTTTLPDRVA